MAIRNTLKNLRTLFLYNYKNYQIEQYLKYSTIKSDDPRKIPTSWHHNEIQFHHLNAVLWLYSYLITSTDVIIIR